MLYILHGIFLVCFQSNGSFGFVIQKPAGTGDPRLLTVQGAPLSDSFLLFGWSLLAKPHEKKKKKKKCGFAMGLAGEAASRWLKTFNCLS